MIKKIVKYEDYDGNEKTIEVYFHLTEAELTKIEMSEPYGIDVTMRKALESNDRGKIIDVFEKLILTAYGERSPDGARFVKNKELTDKFIQIGAYSSFFMELITSESEVINKFMLDLLPKKLIPPNLG